MLLIGFAGRAGATRLFWSDALTHLIQSVDYDGNDFRSFPADGEPRRLALVVPEPNAATALLVAFATCVPVRWRRNFRCRA